MSGDKKKGHRLEKKVGIGQSLVLKNKIRRSDFPIYENSQYLLSRDYQLILIILFSKKFYLGYELLLVCGRKEIT